MQLIYSKKARIVVADPSEQVRIEVSQFFKEAGFQEVVTCNDVADVRKQIHQKKADWIISSLMATGDKNAFNLLKYIQSDKNFWNIRISFMLDDHESQCLPMAYQQGLLSWFEKPATKESLKDELDHLLKIAKAKDYNSGLAAAEYCRETLLTTKKWKSLLGLEERLMEYYFGHPDLFLNLAEARFMAGKVDEGLDTIRNLRAFDRKLEARAIELLKKYGFETFKEALFNEQKEIQVKLGHVVIVDNDTAAVPALEGKLKAYGVAEIRTFQDGEMAWQYLESASEPDLTLMEWKLPKLNGPALLQRIRSKGYTKVPVIIVSSLLQSKDSSLLSEMSVSNVVQKPVVKEEFDTACKWTIVQDRMPSEAKSLERKILTAIKCKDLRLAHSYRCVYFAMKSVTEGERKFVEGEFAFAQSQFEEAKKMAIESIRAIGKGSLKPLNLLGKSLMKLKDFDAALQILEQARRLSPENLEKILDVAEIRLAKNEGQAALDLVDQAKAIDPTHTRVQSLEVRSAISAKKINRASELLKTMASMSEVVSYMNNRAVTLAKIGRFNEAVELYENTISSLPESQEEIKVTVMYNLGLCYARQNQLPIAEQWMKQVGERIRHPVYQKARSLTQRIRDSIAKNQPLILLADSQDAPQKAAGADIFDNIDDFFESIGGESDGKANRNDDFIVDDSTVAAKIKEECITDRCLFGIFKVEEAQDDFSQGLLKAS